MGRAAIFERLGIDFPIFAFSHCRDVVAAVTNAGGVGVLGAVRSDLNRLAEDLQWLDRQVKGKPYGVDLLIPSRTLAGSAVELEARIPDQHRSFVAQLASDLGIPVDRALGASELHFAGPKITPEWARQQWEVAREFPLALLVNGLGPMPIDVADDAHSRNMLVAGLVGAPEHVAKHLAVGTDLIIAQGSEAGGHTGELTTMVLVPQVVDEAGAVPVLAAGGIADPRQIAAAMALGAVGVWLGSVWLTTAESDVHPALKRRLLGARSTDTVRSRCSTGKPSRQFRNAWVDAWQKPGAPEPLRSPAQSLLVGPYLNSAIDHEVEEAMCTPAGQAIGLTNEERTVRTVMYELMEGYATALEELLARAED